MAITVFPIAKGFGDSTGFKRARMESEAANLEEYYRL
jgi:hypothetical protein